MNTIYTDTLSNYLPSLISTSNAYSERLNSIASPDITILLISGIFLIGVVYTISFFLSVRKDV